MWWFLGSVVVILAIAVVAAVVLPDPFPPHPPKENR